VRALRRDDGHFQALEGVLFATFLLSVVVWMATAPTVGPELADRDAASSAFARDVLQVLANLPGDAPFESRLHQWTTDAIRGDVSNLSDWINRTMPVGGSWGLYLDNGEELEIIYETGTPAGAVQTQDILLYPDWNYALAFATLDRQPATTTAQTMNVKVIPVQHSYIDREAAGSVNFTNGMSFVLSTGADGILYRNGIPPEYPDALTGFDAPYTTSSLLDFTASVLAYASEPAATYNVTTSLPYETIDRTVYSVHPTYVADAAIQTFLETPRVSADNNGKARPGETATVTYNYDAMPLALGWTVTSREVHVYGPVLGQEVTSGTLSSSSGTWGWAVPRSALYGTYVVEIRQTIGSGGLVQTLHDVTAFDVLRKGVDEPVPPVYRAVLAIWFEGVD